MPRTKVFISYSHNDTQWLERLQVHLEPLVREGRIDLWDDTRIAEGKKWRKEIQQALDAAKVAVLLISPDFLASDFIAENELRPLLAAAEKDEVVILPVILSPSLFDETPSLSQFQSVNPPNKPVEGMTKVEQDALFVEVAKTVLAEAPPPADKDDHTAVQPWNVPQRNPFFTGRETLLKNLHTSLKKQGRAMLSGLGGMGKTQIAIEYAHRHRDEYDAMLCAGTCQTLDARTRHGNHRWFEH